MVTREKECTANMQLWRSTVWRQLGASIDMLENSIVACPENLWGDRARQPEYWYIAFHTLFFLDFYFSNSAEPFAPPEPFGLEELDPAGILPPRVYSKNELLVYLNYCCDKCRTAIRSLSEETAHQDCGSLRPGLTRVELYLYVMRHVQHHTAQLNLILRQTIDSAPRWVGKSEFQLDND